jgi:hypothetical protein
MDADWLIKAPPVLTALLAPWRWRSDDLNDLVGGGNVGVERDLVDY